MIRAAHLLPSLEVGGRERIVLDLCDRAEASGVWPLIITYDRTKAGAVTLSAKETAVVELDRRAADFHECLQRALRANGIDVLHAQGHVSAALSRPVLGQLPMLASLHVALGSGWRWLVPVARGLRAAQHVAAVSDDLARRYRWLAGRQIETIPTGVNLDRFRRLPRPVTGARLRPFTFGIAARLHPVKRHIDVIGAMRSAHVQGLHCRLLIAGEGSEEHDIRRLAQGLNVEMLGAVHDVPAFLAQLDAFILCSDHEGTPAALLEALACGVPCIATRVGGIPSMVGEAALLVPSRDPQALASAMLRLATDDRLCSQLSQMASEQAAGFDLAISARRYAACYADMLHRRAP